ncbi:alpha/beta hydrolase [Pseudonocardia broussonetiae]|uniref:alpha/beta hydrolase n=1 Tax=Pseudonocardia broussonetiae TaxID=2736640 RepID=UPI001557224B|nr:alpha/beta hydrolase [Pseudonocardia broussonetiae]
MPDSPFHPSLTLARWLPRRAVGPRTLRPVRFLSGLAGRIPGSGKGVEVVAAGADVSLRVFRPASPTGAALLWVHGGGFVIGTAAQDDGLCRTLSEELQVVVASVEYRLSPEHPFPVPLEDCHAGLVALAGLPGVDRARIAVGGASAGGGLAAGLALLARERGEVAPVFQLLSYPMLDDRTTLRTDVDESAFRVWDQRANRFGWAAYLGGAVSGLAAPARHEDLAGLPPAWIGLGDLDLFHDEDLAYAQRLRGAGVACEVEVFPGAYHGFDGIEPRAAVSRDFRRAQVRALAGALEL